MSLSVAFTYTLDLEPSTLTSDPNILNPEP